MNNLSQQIAFVAKATKCANETAEAVAEYVSVSGIDGYRLGESLNGILMKLASLASDLNAARETARARWDEYDMFIPVIVGCGKARLRLACSKPNDRTDNPWTTVSVYESLKRKFVARDGERLHVEGSFPVDVINRTGTIVDTIKPL